MAGGKSVGSLSIGVELDAAKAQQGMANLAAEAQSLASSVGSLGKIFAGSFAAGFGVSSVTNMVAELGAKLADLAKWSFELEGRMKAVAVTIKDAFGKDPGWDIAKLAGETGMTLEEVADRMKGAREAGLNYEDSKASIRAGMSFDNLFGGVGEATKGITAMVAKMNTEFSVTTKELESLENRGVKVFEALAESMKLPIDRVKELAELGKISALDAAAAAQAAFNSKGKDPGTHDSFAGRLGALSSPDDTSGYGEFAPADLAAETARLREQFQTQRLAGFATLYAKELETPAERMNTLINNLTKEIEDAAGVTDAAALQNLQVLKDYRDKLAADLDKMAIDEMATEVQRGIDEQQRRLEEINRDAEESFRRWESSFLSVATESESLAYKLKQQMEALSNAQDSGDQFEAAVARRRLGKLGASLLANVPEVRQVDPFAGVSLAGSQEAYQDTIRSMFPPEQLSIQERMAEGIEEMNRKSEEELAIQEDVLRALQGQAGPRLARIL